MGRWVPGSLGPNDGDELDEVIDIDDIETMMGADDHLFCLTFCLFFLLSATIAYCFRFDLLAPFHFSILKYQTKYPSFILCSVLAFCCFWFFFSMITSMFEPGFSDFSGIVNMILYPDCI